MDRGRVGFSGRKISLFGVKKLAGNQKFINEADTCPLSFVAQWVDVKQPIATPKKKVTLS